MDPMIPGSDSVRATKRIKAVLLSAGFGTRLRPMTDTIPTCLLPIRGKPLMQYWFDNLRQAGVEEVVVNTHWLADVVEEFIGVGADRDPKVKLLHEPTLLGSAGTLAELADWASDADIVVSLYGDLLVTQKISDVVDFHLSHDFPFTLTVAEADEPWRRGIATVDGQDIVTEFIEKPKNPVSNLAGAGMYAMSPSVLREAVMLREKKGLPLDLGADLIPLLAGRMKAYRANGIILDIGTMAAYQEAQDLVASHSFIWK
jgi:mannose-1-phosphate guanylyltransferase